MPSLTKCDDPLGKYRFVRTATPFELCEHVEKIIRKMEYVCSAAVTTTFDQGVPAYAINFHTRVASYYCIVAPHDLESASDAEIVAMILKAKA